MVIEGTTQGTITNLDGNYSIIVPGGASVLIFTYVGYLTQARPVGDNTIINVVLQVDVKTLKEMVVVGYTSQDVRNVSGSVSKINPIQLKTIPSSNVAEMLQGMAPGVMVLNTGRPGGAVDVRIRGFTTINNNSPLYVIDGNPTIDGYRFLNPNDIESLQILKDASTASIYGARAGNGVIIITTKKPKLGEPQFTFDSYAGVQTVPTTLPKLLNPSELSEVSKIFWQNSGHPLSENTQYYLADGSWGLPDYLIPNGYSESISGPLDISDYDYYKPEKRYTKANKSGTDWMKQIFAPAPFQNYNFNLFYGTEKGSISLSAGLFNQKGILKYNDYLKYTFRLNSSLNFGKRIRVGEDFCFAWEKGLPDSYNKNVLGLYPNTALTYALMMPSIVPVYDVGGNFAGTEGAPRLADAFNPLGWLERNVKGNYETWLNLMGSFFLDADIVKGLTFRSNFSPTLNMLPEYKNFYWIYPDDYHYQYFHERPGGGAPTHCGKSINIIITGRGITPLYLSGRSMKITI